MVQDNRVVGRVVGVLDGKDNVKVSLDSGLNLEARRLIDCRGSAAGRFREHARIAVQQYYDGSMTTVAVFAILDGLDFYGWVIPKGRYTIVGALKEHLQAFNSVIREVLEVAGFGHESLRHPVSVREHTITLPHPNNAREVLRMLVNRGSNIIPAGEAAGLVTRNWGEGIYPALVSGETAALYYDDPREYVSKLASLLDFMDVRFERASRLYNLGI